MKTKFLFSLLKMSMKRSSSSYNFPHLVLLIARYRSRAARSIPYHLPELPTPKHRCHFQVNQGLQLLNTDCELHGEPVTKMENNVINNVQQPIPLRRKPAYSTWARWVVGVILSLVVPVWKEKWEKLLRVEGEVEMVAEVVENVAEIVERVATVTEKLSEEVADKLPAEGKLKEAALLIECVSKEVAKDAHLTEDIIHKVGELKQEVETLIEPVFDKEKS